MGSLHDVARRAGVSVATVSRVLSGSSHPVRPGTRERVLQAAEELDFRPNLLARALVTARTYTIAAIVHDISDPYFGEIVRGLEDAAREHGYHIFVCSSDRDPERELAYVKKLMSHRVDAIVFAGGGIEDAKYKREVNRLLDGFEGEGRAVVTLSPHSYRAPRISVDNAAASEAMTRYLIGLGHRRIATAAGPMEVRTARVRLGGYRRALEQAGIGYDPDLVEGANFSSEGGAVAAARLVERAPDLTAIFAANDVTALGVMAELNRRRLRVPEEVSVVGFDDIQAARYMSPALTTVRVPMYEVGREGVGLALSLIAGRRARGRIMPFTLEVRESAAPPARGRIDGRRALSGSFAGRAG